MRRCLEICRRRCWKNKDTVKTQPSLADVVIRRFRRVTSSTTFVPQIDGLRCLAITTVFLYHVRGFLGAKSHLVFTPRLEDDWLGRLTLSGNFGVSLFFTLSGFILALPFASRAFQRKPIELKRYLLRRITRLEPPYFVAMTLLFILLCSVRSMSAAALLPHLLAGFGYVHNIVYGQGNFVNNVAWSLEIEVQFYLLMPLLAIVFRVPRRTLRRGILCSVAAGFILLQIRCVPPHGVMALSLLNFIQFFLAGLLLADVYLLEWRDAPARSYGWDAVGIACWILLAAVLPRPGLAHILTPVLLLPAVGSVFLGRASATVFSNRWVTAIGGMCYSIYLLHYQIISAISRWTVDLGITHYFWVNLIVQCLIVAPVALLTTAVFFLLVERPCMREHWPRELTAWLRTRISASRAMPWRSPGCRQELGVLNGRFSPCPESTAGLPQAGGGGGSRMRIGHYSPWLISPGGVNSYLRRVVQGQRKRGHEVILFDRPGLVPTGSTSAFGAEIVSTLDDADLLQLIRARGLDVLHAHTVVEVPGQETGTDGFPNLVRTMHGHEAYCPSGTRYLARPTGRPCPRGCHLLGCTWGHFINRCGSIRPKRFVEDFRRVQRERRSAQRFFTIAISRFAKEQMVRAGYEASAIRVIYHPAPDSPLTAGAGGRLADQDGPPRFLFLGRIAAEKGLDWLIRAAAQVHVDVVFEIIGDGPGKPRLLELSRRLGVDERFSWLGWLESEREIFARLAAARAVIFPSLWHEPAGLVTLEAAAAARAVIASRVGGIPEYAEKLGHALLVAPNDTEALAAAITRLADDADLAAQLGQAGWQRLAAGEFSLNKHLDQLEEVYARALGREPLAPSL